MFLTFEILSTCIPEASSDNVSHFVDPLNNACSEFDISTAQRIAAFVAQCAHESGNLKFVKENLNYSAQGLCKIFGKYFTPDTAQGYNRNPEAIANRVYANRMGNGPKESGDGWRYRGRGLIQLTGHDNYVKCGQGLGVDLNENPEYLETPEGAARSAGWFWNSRNLNQLADIGDMKTMTKKINGGFIGLEDRIKHYEHALQALGG
jgi:putative chitinase